MPSVEGPGTSALGVLGDPRRLEAIARLELRGHLGDADLDAIVATVADACDVPMAFITIVTPDLQTFPAEVGMGTPCTNFSDIVSVCAKVVRTGRPFAVPDLASDPVLRHHPLVTTGVFAAYAGVPLVHGGHVIGALCIGDDKSRTFTPREHDVLLRQARLAAAILRLRALGSTDTLTGLMNRPLFLVRVQRALARQPDRVVSLLVFAVAGISRLNAALGSAGGDAGLVAVAKRLGEVCGPADSIARIGGDEFAVLFDDSSSEGEARAQASALHAVVCRPLHVDGVRVDFSLRSGLTTTYTDSADELLSAAELAAAEDNNGVPGRPIGKDDVSPGVTELRRAIEQEQLVLHYQPVVHLSTRSVVGVEALVRWQHPHRGLLPPMDFIPLAEESGLIGELGDWVLRSAAAQAAAWQAAGRALDVAVNLSPLQMSVPGFDDRFWEGLASADASPQNIVLEVTESALLDQPDATESLMRLRAMGVRLALDDFGTGYASFSYLRRFEVDVIKIDRSFVAGIGCNADDDAIVSSMVGLAHDTGKLVVAEGVETEEQLAILLRFGVQMAQGFLWSQALPVDELEDWIDAFMVRGGAVKALQRLQASVRSATRRGPEDSRVLRMHAGGASPHTIAAALNRDGLRTPAGVRWHERSVSLVIASFLQPDHRRDVPRRQPLPSPR